MEDVRFSNYRRVVSLFRPEIADLEPYVAGRPIEDVVREHGISASQVVKLASNESPEGPFPGVVEAVVDALAESNRYPEDEAWDLVTALAVDLGVDSSQLLLGNGSVALISNIANAVGGPGTNMVFGWPSFVMYRLAAVWAGSEPRAISLDGELRLDLGAMSDAIDEHTRVVFVCNPNNPTGSVVAGSDVEEFVRSLPSSLLVVVDEAYHEYVDDPGYYSMAPLVKEIPNLVVLRTFSKIFALAAFRIGYGIAAAETLSEIRKGVAPFTVNRLAQAAALASLGQPEELARRAKLNAAGRRALKSALDDRGLQTADSQTNFIFFKTPGDSQDLVDKMTRHGVIVRPVPAGWARVTVGSEAENQRFVEVLDLVL